MKSDISMHSDMRQINLGRGPIQWTTLFFLTVCWLIAIAWSAPTLADEVANLAERAHPTAAAKNFFPVLIYGIEGKYDRSFNAAAYAGAERFKKEFGIDYADFQDTNVESQREKMIRTMVRKGHNPIVSVTYAFANAIKKVAPDFPKTKFVIFGTTANGNNIKALQFNNQEGTFLVGMAAALATKTNKVGLITAVDVPLMRAFGCGYIQGVKYVNKNITVIENIVGTTLHAFNDPARGAEIAKSQFDQGVDVVFPAAGATGLGVLQAAKDANKLGIGFYVNQNYLYPGFILTSMVEGWDTAVYEVFRSVLEGSWKPGNQWIGIKEHAIDWALDQYNRSLITPDMEARINMAKADIIDGKIKVVDFRKTGNCPVK